MERLILSHTRSPGDVLVMTALVRDIHRTYPGRYRIAVDTPAADLWRHNPHVVPLRENADGRVVPLSYGGYMPRATREPVHFLAAFHRDFERQVGVRVPLTAPTPDLHMTASERSARRVDGRYWVVVSGGKLDFTTKHWVYARHQQVVDGLRGLGLGVVQVGSVGPGHHHPKLTGVVDLTGQTTMRGLIQVVSRADGVICTITLAMHLAAALGKPCVVTAGGREEWVWEAYCRDNPGLAPVAHLLPVDHRYLHTIGELDCCRTRGCWKNKVLPTPRDRSVCVRPLPVERGQTVPRCMDMLTADRVLEAAVSYYRDGTLRPVVGLAARGEVR